ncbi:MAG TPA: Dabb family protein [Vicinamibacteria bacterium]|nr:Dabb family protein [Vicinamibacteria bacterium]
MVSRFVRWALAGAFALGSIGPRAAAADGALSHDVFVSLNDASAAAASKLVAACQKYLSGHEGTVFFSVGTLAKELQRDVNDRDFEVALHVTFKDKVSHDKYQEHPRHKQFIEENRANWRKVRVFDSWVSAGR